MILYKLTFLREGDFNTLFFYHLPTFFVHQYDPLSRAEIIWANLTLVIFRGAYHMMSPILDAWEYSRKRLLIGSAANSSGSLCLVYLFCVSFILITLFLSISRGSCSSSVSESEVQLGDFEHLRLSAGYKEGVWWGWRSSGEAWEKAQMINNNFPTYQLHWVI